ncbi:HAD family hydrolase [Arthrobacter oryzae]|uniref:HAD superfamily hydrolase (TIGR01509 family) n=1 Tax=Arthrobacter oryzae TaxID=409290 RepID=A0A495EB28_9MICC|nr:HAD family phosphatase [Arthrobacter oryzae]RKR13753.1 HAD superfamily hydrolase (TIGR01509 family) [Arthrobacter oryzae]
MTAETERDLQAVLWDMDGTLVDTEPYWLAAQGEIARQHGLNWTTQDAHATVGQAMPVSAALLQQRGVALSAEEIINDLLERVVAKLEGGIPWLPGAERILADLAAAHIPSALVTMAFSPVATRVAASAPIGTFHAVVAGDAVPQGKPHPAPYLAAAELLNVHPFHCVAVEDSVSGTTSAQAAGMEVVVVPGVVQPPHGPGRHFVSSLENVTVENLRDILRGPNGRDVSRD